MSFSDGFSETVWKIANRLLERSIWEHKKAKRNFLGPFL
jgi:hypothetical protein